MRLDRRVAHVLVRGDLGVAETPARELVDLPLAGAQRGESPLVPAPAGTERVEQVPDRGRGDHGGAGLRSASRTGFDFR